MSKWRNLSCVFCMFAALGLSACDDDNATHDDTAADCGNAQLEDGESCDDGNTDDDDGCSTECVVEEGWECKEPGEPCTKKKENKKSVCGDGKLAKDEDCDDGNKKSGDGCSSGCVVEDGWTCSDAGEPCSRTDDESACGDGQITGGEACDDGNTEAGDGCSDSCAIEEGWTCGKAGQACTEDKIVCGDGKIGGDEKCDDGNTNGDDGCSSSCTVEEGWNCPSAGAPCEPIVEEVVCGDGKISGEEACDDSNTENGDGCSSSCIIEEGWVCATAGESCTAVCGDSVMLGAEACDDGNTEDGDGCSAACAVEEGWTCDENGKTCTTTCGDGILAGEEECDDGNTEDGDGCTKDCVIEEAYVCEEAGKACKPEFDDKKSIKILGIGNSFMTDSTVYLRNILKNMGYTDVTIGMLHTGGMSINWHAENIRQGKKPAHYFLYKTNSFKEYDKNSDQCNYKKAIKSEKWDYFIMQTYPSGVIDLYNDDIDYVIKLVKESSPNVVVGWSMTWALQLGTPHFQMPFHGHDPQKMYEATVMAVVNKIKPHKDIPMVIPVGTAIQNLRHGIFGDNMNRDGYHMTMNNGRFAANLMWAKQITKRPISKVTFKPDYSYSSRQIAAIKEAVINAYKNPYEVTRPATGVDGTYLKPNEELQKVFTDAGYKLEDYVEVPIGVTTKAKYDATKKDSDVCSLTAVHSNNNGKYCTSAMVSAETGSKAKDLKKYAASRIFSQYEIPIGSFIVVKSGYEYRPEGWGSNLRNATAANSRPGIVKEQIIEVTDKWWGSFEYRAFTISKSDGSELKDNELETDSVMSIFVPIHGETTDDALTKANYDLSKYKKLDLSMSYRRYWNSNTKSDLSPHSVPGENRIFPSKLFDGNDTAAHYAATRIFDKSEIPNGSLIVAMKGYAYIPDAWIELDVTNNGTGRRPKMVSADDADSIVVVDDQWWGEFKFRGFDITEAGVGDKAKFTALQETMLGEKFAIYVPQ